MKKLAVLALAAYLVGAVSGVVLSGEGGQTYLGHPVVRVMVNGEVVQVNPGEPPAMIINGRTVMPVRAVLEAIGARVSWSGETQTVMVQGGAGMLALGEEITVEGVTVTVQSVRYEDDGLRWAYVTLHVENNAELPINDGLYGRLCVASDCAEADDPVGRSGAWVTADKPGRIEPGESRTLTYKFRWFHPTACITTVTYSADFWDESGVPQYIRCLIGTWEVPTE